MHFLTNIYIGLGISLLLMGGIIYLLRVSDKNQKELNNKISKENTFMITARDNLLRSVNHELRAPLARMKIDIEMLKDEFIKESLNEDVNFMHSLVEELMEIEKIKVEKLDKRSLDITKLINDVINRLDLDLENLYFEQEDPVHLKGDERKLEKLFKNLIENANKYKSKNGSVRLKIHDAKKKVILTIMNEGTSVPTEDLPFLFEPFYRVDKSRESSTGGLGLGLNICKEIVNVHNGKIQVSSKKDLGTIFKITLLKA